MISETKAKMKKDKRHYRDVRETHMRFPHKTPNAPTDSQLELIEKLIKRLENAGHDVSYLKNPQTNDIAKQVINSLFRLCKKYGIERGDCDS